MILGFMVSSPMALQDECGGIQSNPILPTSNGISLNSLHPLTVPESKDQFSSLNDYSLKARKPYTITKQRERWTEEEHKKFLEALKLYGRAWRKIEEHVGSKSAVQIRSHAQKFFSKVVRESSGSNTCSVEPIEIPPPRPKRKPMHPYPRKLVHPIKKELVIPEQSLRSSSPNLSISDQDESQSPTSVLSVVGSDVLGSSNSNTPNCCLSTASCVGDAHPVECILADPNLLPGENRCPSSVLVSSPVEQESQAHKFVLFPEKNTPGATGHAERTSVRSLKLFGRTVLVTECHRPSPPTVATSKILPSDSNEGKLPQPLPWNLIDVDQQSASRKRPWTNLLEDRHGVLYCMQFMKDNSSIASDGSLQWWTPYGGMPFNSMPFEKHETLKVNLASNGEEVHDGEIQKEGSWTGSNSGSVSPEHVERNAEGETQSRSAFKEEKELYPSSDAITSRNKASFDLRDQHENSTKGFVPYKKRVVEKDSQSSTITGEESEEEKTCLRL